MNAGDKVLHKKEVNTKNIIKFTGVFILLAGLVIGIDIDKAKLEKDTEQVNINEDSEIVSYEDIGLPGNFHFDIIDGRKVLIKTTEKIVGTFDSDDISKQLIVSDGYYLEPEYYGFKKIIRISRDKKEEQIIKIEASKTVDEEGNIEYSVPDGYELGIRYKLIKYEDEIIYLDNFINENNELNKNKLVLELSRG